MVVRETVTKKKLHLTILTRTRTHKDGRNIQFLITEWHLQNKCKKDIKKVFDLSKLTLFGIRDRTLSIKWNNLAMMQRASVFLKDREFEIHNQVSMIWVYLLVFPWALTVPASSSKIFPLLPQEAWDLFPRVWSAPRTAWWL